MTFEHRNLLGIADLSPADIVHLLDAADRIADEPSCARGALAGRQQVNAFFENSTRTLLSFEMAGRRAGAEISSLAIPSSSVAKGESLLDTALTIEALGADFLVLRYPETGAPRRLAERLKVSILNAGDGVGEHPTQALIDALTLRRHFGRLEGLSIAICGDIRHSRVAHSNRLLLEKVGARVRLSGPPSLLPDDAGSAEPIEEALDGVDAVMMLRVQHERLDDALELSGSEYHGRYGLTAERLQRAASHAVVLHPGPMNRGVEIAGDVADGPRSLILAQVALGVPVRMACLVALGGARRGA